MAELTADMLSAVCFLLIFASCIVANELPDELQVIPRLEDHDWKRQLSGLANRQELMQRPRVIFGYLSEKDWALTEFLCFMHSSWRYVTSLAEPAGKRIDLMVFSDQRWLREVSTLCEPIQLAGPQNQAEDGQAAGLAAAAPAAAGEEDASGVSQRYAQLQRRGNTSTCWVVPYPRPPRQVWQGYPFVASYHFLADPRVADLLTANYGYAMKTDFDCFITATLIQHFPTHLEVGYMHYTPLAETRQRLQRVAAGLGLRHRGVHDIGPTWYGDVSTLIALANASLPLVHYLLDTQFPEAREPDGSWRGDWASGEGWPLWSRDMAVMYAPELVLNHAVENFEVSYKYDVHGDSPRYTFGLYHIHCQHGDGNFSKFEFFRHKYRDRDITSGLDFNRVRDYALFLSVATWRQLEALQATEVVAGQAGPAAVAAVGQAGVGHGAASGAAAAQGAAAGWAVAQAGAGAGSDIAGGETTGAAAARGAQRREEL